ncbi:MAG TPA: hypothetical protein VHZ25_00450 [Acidobacteriaceae bacterium]|jgi:hypothetical protein|nr:hypothetical protein [Acidobacteriaceae bacterium]
MGHLQEIFIKLEPVLVVLAAFCFFKSKSARRLPAMATFLVVRLVSLAYLQIIFYIDPSVLTTTHTGAYEAYFYGYWVTYIAITVSVFFVVQEVFKRVMEPVPGLRRLGLMAFRWISVVSIMVAVGAVALPNALAEHTNNPDKIGPVCVQMMRCVSVMELCLLAFLALSIHSLGRSFRSRLFGLGAGFGLQAAADLIYSAIPPQCPGLLDTANFMDQTVTLMVLVTWSVYFLIPEPEAERNLIVLPPQSMLARWNALAKGLGQMPEPVTAGAPTGFFLQDIEGVVDRVLAKNPVVAPR